MSFRILELFSGLGGWRYALEGLGQVVAAYDISPLANATYAHNHGDAPWTRELASIRAEAILAHEADLWAMSPPCQPFCRMGHGLGLEDARSRAYLHLLDILRMAKPRAVVLENVVGFVGSEAQQHLLEIFKAWGYHWAVFELCPTRFGMPNQRPRAYVIASPRPLELCMPEPVAPGPLRAFLDPCEDPSLYLSEGDLAKHKPGLDLVRADTCRSACFIGGYGQRFVGSGSFLVTERGIRRFSPKEIARLMGLPDAFGFPERVPREAQYKLLGNSLSIPVARWVAQRL